MGKLVKVTDITKFGNFLARSVRARLKWSKQLRNDVRLTPARENGDTVSISIAVGSTKQDRSGRPLTGMARAFEYGSGLHATRAIRQRYKIVPFRKGALSFSSTLGVDAGNFIARRYVMHPGVQPRPFLQPAIQEAYNQALPTLRLDIKRNIVNELNAVIKQINGNR